MKTEEYFELGSQEEAAIQYRGTKYGFRTMATGQKEVAPWRKYDVNDERFVLRFMNESRMIGTVKKAFTSLRKKTNVNTWARAVIDSKSHIVKDLVRKSFDLSKISVKPTMHGPPVLLDCVELRALVKVLNAIPASIRTNEQQNHLETARGRIRYREQTKTCGQLKKSWNDFKYQG